MAIGKRKTYFDTLKVSRTLEDKAGFGRDQAHGIVEALVTTYASADLATRDDLKSFATRDDLKNFATKDDLKNFATKDDAKNFATKEDLNNLETHIMNKIDTKFAKFSEDMNKTLNRHMINLYGVLLSSFTAIAGVVFLLIKLGH